MLHIARVCRHDYKHAPKLAHVSLCLTSHTPIIYIEGIRGALCANCL